MDVIQIINPNIVTLDELLPIDSFNGICNINLYDNNNLNIDLDLEYEENTSVIYS